MAFPTTGVLDDFNTGAAQNVTARAGWRAATWITTPLVTDAVPTYASIASGAAGGDWGSTFTADQEVWTTFNGASAGWALYGRYSFAAGTGYVMSQAASGGNITINVWTGFSNGTQIGSVASGITVAAGDSVGLECIGTTISGYFKASAGAWSQIITGSNATYNSGAFSIITFNAPPTQFRDVGGGSVVVASTLRSLALTGVGA